jgi:hypothetical protein
MPVKKSDLMTLWLNFLHVYFVALCVLTAGALIYLAWLLWPLSEIRNARLTQGAGEAVEEGVGAGTAP